MDDNPEVDRRTPTPGWPFCIRWAIATVIGWVVGVIGTIILSHAVVNLVYPKETNLILGLCLGTAVALSQRVAARPYFTLSHSWVWGAAVGIGIPFVVFVLLHELRPDMGWHWWFLLIFAAGGAICGALQARALRPHTSRAYWWVLASAISWCGGPVLTAASCGVFVWLLKSPMTRETPSPSHDGP